MYSRYQLILFNIVRLRLCVFTAIVLFIVHHNFFDSCCCIAVAQSPIIKTPISSLLVRIKDSNNKNNA